MILTSVNRLDTSDTQWQVVHLFEHILINRFYSELERNNISPALAGWVQADAFEKQLFIETGFYNKKSQDLFNTFLMDKSGFTATEIERAIDVIQSEDKVSIAINSTTELASELQKLLDRSWNNATPSLNDNAKITPLAAKQRPGKFRDITIETRATSLTADEQKLMLRLQTILIDIAFHALRSVPGAYSRGDSPLARQGDAVGFLSHYTTPNDISTKSIQQLLSNTVSSFDIEQHLSAINDHFTAYAKEPLWQAMSTDYYRETGIITSTAEVASLATKDTIQSLLSKVRYVVRPFTPQDGEHIA